MTNDCHCSLPLPDRTLLLARLRRRSLGFRVLTAVEHCLDALSFGLHLGMVYGLGVGLASDGLMLAE